MFEHLLSDDPDEPDDRATLRRIIGSLEYAQRLAHLGSWQWDLRADRLEWSDEVFRLFGLEPGSVAPHYELFLELVHPEDRERVDGIVTSSMSSEDGHYDATYRVRRPDGEVRHVHALGEVTRDDAGQLRMMLGTVLDVTERLEVAERERTRAEELAVALARAEGAAEAERRAAERERRFLDSISHELRTPMTVLQGVAETLPQVEDEVARARLTGALRTHVARLGGLVDDLLLVAGQGRATAEGRRHVRVGEAVSRAVRQLGDPDRARLDVPGSVVVMVDERLVVRALHAMLDNAVRYGGDGEVDLAARDDAGALLVEVGDRGPGIPGDVREAVFGAFVRGRSRVAHSPGVGVGLTVVRLCATLHSGTVEIEDRPGGGTIVRLRLPDVVTDTAPGTDTSRGTGAAGGRPGTPPDGDA